MSDQQLYAIRENVVAALFERARAVVEGKDLQGWRQLYDVFDATATKPYIGFRGSVAAPIRLTRIEYQSNLPDLSGTEVPDWESASLRWLLRHFVLASCDLHFSGQWPKFAQWFSINLSDELHAQGGPELEEHQFLMDLFFEPIGAFPEPQRVLRMNESAFESYVPLTELNRLLEIEARAGLLRRLFREYAAAPDGVTQGLGAEVGGLLHFLELARSQHQAVYYSQFAT